MEQGTPQEKSSGRRWIVIGAVAVIGCCVLVGIVLAISGAALGIIGGLVGGLAGTSTGQLTIACVATVSDADLTLCTEWAQTIVDEHGSDLAECEQQSVVGTDEGQLTDYQLVYRCLDERGLGLE